MSASTDSSSMEAQNSTSRFDFPTQVSYSGAFGNKHLISSRTSTATSTATTTSRTSLNTLHPPTWTQPELSIGAPRQSMDVLGRWKCWSLKENSPAHIVWKTLSKRIIELLQGQMEHLATRDSDLMVEMFMIGRKANSASPTVLFSCESKSCRQLALELLKRKSILASYPGVLAAECSRLPRPLALGESIEMPILPSGVYVNGTLRSCGIDVLISTGTHRTCRKATVGGIVCIDNDYFGLTCFHAFSDAKTPDPGEDRDLEFSFYGLNDDDHVLEDFSNENDCVGMTIQGSTSSCPNQLPTTDRAMNLQASPQSLDRPERDRILHPNANVEIKPFVTEPTLLGTFFAGGPPTSNFDWALVKIKHWGFLFSSSTTSLEPELDITINNITSRDRVVFPRHIARVAADTRVLICTGARSMACEGTLSAVASFTKVAGTEKFQELWSVTRLGGDFADGDCGSWVVDFETGVLYGHIVSGHPGTGLAYVLPAVQIFYDMREYHGKIVQLSTAEKKVSLLFSRQLEAIHVSEALRNAIDAKASRATTQLTNDSRLPKPYLPSSNSVIGSSAVISKQDTSKNCKSTSHSGKRCRPPKYQIALWDSIPDLHNQKKKRKTFSDEEKKKIEEVRTKGACAMCRDSKRQCDIAQPCQNCIRKAESYGNGLEAALAMCIRSPINNSVHNDETLELKNPVTSTKNDISIQAPQFANTHVTDSGSRLHQGHNFPPVNPPADQTPPCDTLYVDNLPTDISEDQLKTLFSKEPGYKRLHWRTKKNGPMCLVQFENTFFATRTIFRLYGHSFHNSIKGCIRLSFSKYNLGVRSGQDMISPETFWDDIFHRSVSDHTDGLYHCPWEGREDCTHKPEKLKCNYDENIDFHLKPYRCRVYGCHNSRFSSTASLLRHEREVHAMHSNSDYLCTHEGYERGIPGNGLASGGSQNISGFTHGNKWGLVSVLNSGLDGSSSKGAK